MLESFEKVKAQAVAALKRGDADASGELRKLTLRQRQLLSLFTQSSTITARDVENLFKIGPRTARALCQRWVAEGFLQIVDPSKKARKYGLGLSYEKLLKQPIS